VLAQLASTTRLVAVLDVTEALSNDTIQQAVRLRQRQVKEHMPNLSKDAVLNQFLAAAQAAPYVSSVFFLYSLGRFARLFGLVQDYAGSEANMFFSEMLARFTHLICS
jgi:hypothetical protein